MAVIGIARQGGPCYNLPMDVGSHSNIDALCRRHATFVLYRLPGEEEEVRFCMQKDGGVSTWQVGQTGFLLAPFDGAALFIREELSAPPAADTLSLLRARDPASPATTPEEYARLFDLYTGQMPHLLQKIVLARTEDVPRSPGFSPARAFAQVCVRAPRHFNILLHTTAHGTWLCSTPELLLRGQGEQWETMALAGTRAAGDAEDAPWDAKNRREQQLVADYIRQCLEPLWEEGNATPPHTLRTGQIEHLCTRFRFRMPQEKLGHLLATLPPTPAVCGYPPEAARAWLRRQPDMERGLYAGYLGPVNARGVQLFVTLRCMQLFAESCRLYAGGGLMPDSNAAAEWQETVAKMRGMRQLLQP